MMKRLVSCLLLSSLLASANASAQGDGVREQFRAAAERAERRQPAGDDGTALRGYLLYPDLQGLRLKAALGSTQPPADVDVMQYLRDRAELPVARELQRDWLLDLARREQWAVFLAQLPADTREPALLCHRYQARIRAGDVQALRDELVAFWVQAPQMPQACVAPFQWLQAQNWLTPAQIEARAQKALNDGNVELVDFLAKLLPAPTATRLSASTQLLRDPARGFAVYAAQPAQQYEWPLIEAAFSKLARRDPVQAATVLNTIAPQRLEPGRYAELQRWVALGLAWDRRAEALQWFEKLPTVALDDRAHEWRIKSALWHGRFELALQWLQQLPPAMAAEPRWTYWRARLVEMLRRDPQAEALYRSVAAENGYYALLASVRLKQAHQPLTQTLADDAAAQKALLQMPRVQRARELFLVDRKPWANLEWARLTAGLDMSQRAQAARLASSWGWHVQAVSTLAQTPVKDVFEILYPSAYEREIRSAAKRHALQPDWIYGVMRQESLFDPLAVSRADALGLLQLLLPTARNTARRAQLPMPQREDLFRPEINVPLGAAYLREMTDRFDNQFLLTLAAYNAGPNAVARWLPESPMAPDIWIENVPFNETRGYLQRILWHIAARSWQTSQQAHDIEPLLQPVRRPPSR
jgi:soluble lytic murein transglycosylase